MPIDRAPALFALAACPLTLLVLGCAGEKSTPDRAGPSIAVRLPERDLIPEGIAYDAATGRTFLSSFRKSKVVVVDSLGQARDFILPRAHGLRSTVGLAIDPARRRLWVASASGAYQADFDPKRDTTTGVFVFDLDSARLLWRHERKRQAARDFYNDFALDGRGGAYASTFGGHSVVHFGTDGGAPAPVARFADTELPNGLTLDRDAGVLFVSTSSGLATISVADGRVRRLTAPEGESVAGIDGLYLEEGTGDLLAVQDKEGLGRPGHRIVRLRRAPGDSAIARVEPLADEHPTFDQPTTAALAPGALLVVATSQFTKFDDRARLAPDSLLRDVIVLRIPLAGR
jgi:hypothetical protein